MLVERACEVACNAQAVLAGQLDPEQLGITALDDYTLKIELEEPVPYLLKLFSYSAYMPMNEAYTLSQEHLYGTKSENTIYNGIF